MSWKPERPKVVVPEGCPELPKPYAYIWPDDENEGCFQHHYTPSTPRRGEFSVAIYTECQMLEYIQRVLAKQLGDLNDHKS